MVYLFLFRPVLCLPNREYSIAVRFSPVKYKLRKWQREKSQDGGAQSEGGKRQQQQPWEENRTLFALPYRMVYAVATLNTVVLYDTQQEEPFARVSQIHFIGLTDLAWYVRSSSSEVSNRVIDLIAHRFRDCRSADGNMLIVSSTDGFSSFITFRPGEIGEVYAEEGEKEKENVVGNATSDKSANVQTPAVEKKMDTKSPLPAVST